MPNPIERAHIFIITEEFQFCAGIMKSRHPPEHGERPLSPKISVTHPLLHQQDEARDASPGPLLSLDALTRRCGLFREITWSARSSSQRWPFLLKSRVFCRIRLCSGGRLSGSPHVRSPGFAFVHRPGTEQCALLHSVFTEQNGKDEQGFTVSSAFSVRKSRESIVCLFLCG